MAPKRRWRFRVLFLAGAILMFTTLWTFLTLLVIAAGQDSQRQNSLGDGRKQRHLGDGEDDFIGHGVQVVVGHYNGKLPDEPKINLTKEELNANRYHPVEGEGELGRGVKLSQYEESIAKDLFRINQFNLVASDKIPTNRSLPDVRRKACRDKEYPADLPTTTVIIVFHNEAWSTLLRTLTSVINRSPHHLLKQVILVDDLSDRDFLKDPLDQFTAGLPVPVLVLHSPTRIGLIRARLLGAAQATGDVLTFLDSHCEATEGWLEPLLARIKEDRTRVVCPVIDVINDKNFAYQRGLELFRGGFNWNLQFRWYAVPPLEQERRGKDPSQPIRSPTMAGGLFSIDRSYFEELGAYDPQMDIWGGENLEISFRVWQCGGSIEILPCSHVGHIFRKASPHDFPDKKSGTILNSNLVRVAEVWMDDWKYLFYKTAPQALELSKGIDVSGRKAIRQKFNCKDFRWYLEEVWPDHFLPVDSEFFGRIKSVMEEVCMVVSYVFNSGLSAPRKVVSMDSCTANFTRLQMENAESKGCITSTPGEVGKRRHALAMKPCTLGFDMWQLWVYNKDGYIRSDEHQCLGGTSVKGSWVVQLRECGESESERWDFDKSGGRFIHRKSGLCLNNALPGKEGETRTPTLQKCARFRSGSSEKWILMPVEWKPR